MTTDNDHDEELWKDEDFLSFRDESNPPPSKSNSKSPIPPPPPTSQSASGGSSSRPDGDNGGSSPYEDEEEADSDSDSEDDSANIEDSSSLPPWMEQVNPTTESFARGGGLASPRHQHRPPPPLAVVPPLVRLHNEIVGYARLVEPTSHEVSTRQRLIDRVKKIAIQVFGTQSQVLVFGSQATGLFLPTSDIDLVVLTKPEEDIKKEREQQKKNDKDNNGGGGSFDPAPLRQFASGLREAWESSSELSYLEVIENTRVPLVKFTHAPTNISIDVSFDLPDSGPPAATLMNTYLEALPPLRPLTLVTKSLLAARGLNQPYTGGVGSYMLQIMIVAFLQQRERDAVVFHRRPTLNLGALLMDFLEFYGLDFNFVTTGISVRNDGFFFPKGSTNKREWFYAADRPQLMALENPLDTTQDVGKSSFRIGMVQRAFKVSHNLLLARVSEPPPSTSRPFEAPSSILAAVLPVTAEMVQRGRTKQRILRRQLRRNNLEGRSPANPKVASSGRGSERTSALNQPLSTKRDSRNETLASPDSLSKKRNRKRQRKSK